MKSALRLMPLMIAALSALSAQAWTPGGGAGANEGYTGGGIHASAGGASVSDIDAVKGTVGIVCVDNKGDKITWYPAAANSAMVASLLKRCFEEVAMNWDGVKPPAGLPSDAVREVPTPIDAYLGLMSVMGQIERIAP